VKLRSRVVLAFAYILLVVIVALTVPLAIQLSQRAEAELKTDTLVQAQTYAAFVGSENIDRPANLRKLFVNLPPEIQRVVVMNLDGIVTYDSEGQDVGQQYNNGKRPEVAAALDGQPFAEVRYSEDIGHNIMVAAAPVIDEQLRGAIRITRDYGEVDTKIRQTVFGLGAIGLAGLGAGVLIAFGLAGSLSHPIQRLADAARRLGGGDLSARAGDVGGAAEVKDLAHSFDDMAGRLERTVQAQREFVANASHQLRTPLTGMKLRLEGAIADAPNDDVERQLIAAEKEVDRLSAIVDRLLVMAQEIEQGVPTHVDLHEAAQLAVDRWLERADLVDSSLTLIGDGALVQANPTDLDQILDNLLDNALSYAPGAIDVETGVEERRGWIAVRDRGRGIPPQEQDRVVERFYRGKGAPAGGSGLGLAIARELAEKWGGSLTVTDADGGGTRIVVRLRIVRTGADQPLPEVVPS
jgi:signal transduction histidine kinase